MIDKIVIKNYKIFKDFELNLNPSLNILVGDNESGKSTILEAINLCLSRKINGKPIDLELSSYLFNNAVVREFIEAVKLKITPILPEILIEVYLNDSSGLDDYRGTNNTKRENSIGVKIQICFNEDYKDEYEKLITTDPTQIQLIPTEYYKVNWRSFADNTISPRGAKVVCSFIDASSIHLQNGTDYYLQSIIKSGLNPKERAELSIAYRKLKEEFAKATSIQNINRQLDNDKGAITSKNLEITLDVSQKTNWEANLIPHLDKLPFHCSGKGEQSSLKIMLALQRKADDSQVILIEEPENNQSFSSMNILLEKIKEKCGGKQIIITTHSAYVLNKLGLQNLMLLANQTTTNLSNLPESTQKYFNILSGYDTLRIILAKRSILVEGPSDELIIQKAYFQKHRKLPIQNGIDVINVRGLSFARFLDIAKELNLTIAVVTDNDGNYDEKVTAKYASYVNQNIKVYASNDNTAKTLEPQLIKAVGIVNLNTIFETSHDQAALEKFMTDNKTDCALKIFDYQNSINFPDYINDAIE
jgi:predicted ATP-dependent endonuclease of OLD family